MKFGSRGDMIACASTPARFGLPSSSVLNRSQALTLTSACGSSRPVGSHNSLGNKACSIGCSTLGCSTLGCSPHKDNHSSHDIRSHDNRSSHDTRNHNGGIAPHRHMRHFAHTQVE